MADTPTQSHAGRGPLLVAVGACGFGTISTLVTLATGAGVPLLSVVFWRYALAVPVLIAGAAFVGALRLDRHAVKTMALAGLGQTLIAVLTLSALRYISVATLAFLFYTFPAWVALRAAILRTERLTGTRLFSLLLSFSGVGIMVGWPGAEAVHPLGAGLALTAAVVYALFIPLIDRLREGVSAVVATAWVAVGALLIFLAAAVVTKGLVVPSTAMSWLYIVGLGTVSTALAFTLFLRGLQVVGPVMASIVTTAEPFFVAALAALVLGQPITVQTVIGGSFIAIAVLILHLRVDGAFLS